jgi:hypothetical protein
LDERAAIPDALSAVVIPPTYVNGWLFASGEFEPRALLIFLQQIRRIESKNINKGE